MRRFHWLFIGGFLMFMSGTPAIWPLWSAYFPRSLVPHAISAYLVPKFTGFILVALGAGFYAEALRAEAKRE